MVLDLIALSSESRVWIYVADRELTYDEIYIVRDKLEGFLNNWASHNVSLDCYGNVFHKRFLALFVDPSRSGASGCSIDSSVHFIEELGKELGVDFFNRRQYSYFQADEEIITLSESDFKEKYVQKEIDGDTLVFDHLVNSKEKFINQWVRPLSTSWLTRIL